MLLNFDRNMWQGLSKYLSRLKACVLKWQLEYFSNSLILSNSSTHLTHTNLTRNIVSKFPL